jgi:hypothetical protein
MDDIQKLRASRLQKLHDMGPVEVAKAVLEGYDEATNFGLSEDDGTQGQPLLPSICRRERFTALVHDPALGKVRRDVPE